MTATLRWAGAAVTSLLAVGGLCYWWGFSVDDAWIVTRVAQHGLEGAGFVFNAGRPRSDAVTPLGFAHLVAAWAKLSGSGAFSAARQLGVLGWLFTMAAPLASFRRVSGAGAAVLAVGAASLGPVHAWAGAGLETPLVAAVFTLGALLVESRKRNATSWGAGLLSAAVAWRPELAPAAAALILSCFSRPWEPLEVARQLVLLAALPALVAALRFQWFGSLLPLSFVAKSPLPELGLRYAVGGVFFCAVPALLFGVDASPRSRRALLVLGVHGMALTFAGGDWMPLYRLWVPILPWLLTVTAEETTRFRWRGGLGLALSLLLASIVFFGLGPDSRAVLAKRLGWVARARPLLAGSCVVAAADVGWVGQATSATIVDLGGITDPTIAALPGGHTSKRLSPGLFAARDVDTWIFRVNDDAPSAELDQLEPVLLVDQRLLRQGAANGFELHGEVAVEGTESHYVMARLQATSCPEGATAGTGELSKAGKSVNTSRSSRALP